MHFVNIQQLAEEQTKGFPSAILIGIALSPSFLKRVAEMPDYVEWVKREKQFNNDEFHLAEIKTDALADFAADYLRKKNFEAYSQSESNIEKTGFYDTTTKSTPLPHKTIALKAGLGWIGKHNLLVTPEYGSAISMCTVLTNAPLETIGNEVAASQCRSCSVCTKVCPAKVLKGTTWEKGTSRDEIIDVHHCTTCLQCMVQCPYTKQYASSGN